MAEEIITFLEMRSPDALRCPRGPVPSFTLSEVTPPDADLHRGLYEQVGRDWQWTDRLGWDRADWQTRSIDPDVLLWVAMVEDQRIGFIELERQKQGAVEIAYFGLLPAWIGQGYGGAVLAAGVARAWGIPGIQRVWLHTCNLDHPRALANYRARGFYVHHVEHVAIQSV